jgi:DNA-binding NarL/FixJ family response regulator
MGFSPKRSPDSASGADIAEPEAKLSQSVRFAQTHEVLVLIDARPLERECFVRSLLLARPRLAVDAYRSLADWQAAQEPSETPLAILFNAGARNPSDADVRAEVELLAASAAPKPVIVLAQSEDVGAMIAAIESGARGYIPASVGIDVIYEAARVAAVGGIFVPTASALSLRGSIAATTGEAASPPGRFTPRQAAVADALRCGKANKIIAYELNMRESTVKIHVRTILKKLAATNRTEAAFKLNTHGHGH